MAVTPLKQTGDSTWLMEGPTNIGFIKTPEGIYLVDSGNDKESGRKINQILKEREWKLAAVINTHSNADHIGGNDYLQRNLGCPIYASPVEKAFTENPRLEAAFLWGGMEVKELRNKFFLAKPSTVTHITDPDKKIGGVIGIFPLPGHYFDMIGVESPDEVLFVADALFGPEILSKYKIPFIFDVTLFRESIESIRNRKARFYIPSHGRAQEDIEETAYLNLRAVDKLERDLKGILSREMNFDLILREICGINGITLDFGQYALVGCTIRSFLSWMYNGGKITCEFKDNMMYWRSI